MKCHRWWPNGHGSVSLNNESRFKFAMSTYTRAAHHCDQRWTCVVTALSDRRSEPNLTTVSIATFRLIGFHWRVKFHIFILYIEKQNKARSPTVPLHQPSWVINMSEHKTWFEAYFMSFFNGIGKHSVPEGWLVVDMHAGVCSAHQIWNAHNIPISPVYCQQQPIPALWDSIHEFWDTVAQARIRRSV